ncbi:MAG: FAD:protein FMN transferase [Spirochaetota bacterium]
MLTRLAAALLPLLLVLVSCSRESTITETRIALGTYVKVTVVAGRGKEDAARRAVESGYRLVERFERVFDHRSEEGGLARFNRGTVLRRESDPLLFSLLQDSLRYARLTGGSFDPTVLPVIRAWGFDTGNPSVPGPRELERALERVGYGQVVMTDEELRKPGQVTLDLSGVAKGKIVDLLRDHLQERGFLSMLIDAGGDIYAGGTRPGNQPWRVAIQDPEHRNRYWGVLAVHDRAVVTSGDYERFFTAGGRRYSHLINPRTGYPDSDCRSVTVLSEDTAFGDAVATAVFVMGRERGLQFLREQGIPGLILYEGDGGETESISTPGFWD